MSFLTALTLQNFRCYEAAKLADLSSGLIVLCGANGAGKTNILEAVSLLNAGRGLRNVKATDMQRHGESMPWGIAANISHGGVDVKLGTALNPQTTRRMVRINGVDAKSQNALSDYIACLWLTPQMDRLFLEGASGRRKFLDRLIFTFDSGHSGRVTRFENAMRQRSKLLQEGGADPSWLDGLESQMAQTAVNFFPKAHIAAQGTIEELLSQSPALEVEKKYTIQLKESRARDALVGGATTGPHKSDFGVTYAAKNMPAEQCSTGEQKALLIGIILARGAWRTPCPVAG